MGDMTAHGGAIVVGFPMVLIGGQPAARSLDMHVCPMVNPGLPPPPHVGGPVMVGSPTVLIGSMPAARMGDMAVCAGPPDVIVGGCPTVLIGEAGAGGGGGAGSGGGAGAGGASEGQKGDKKSARQAKQGKPGKARSESFSAETGTGSSSSEFGMKLSTRGGEPPGEETGHWVEFQFVDSAGLPVGGPCFEFTGSDGEKARGIVQGDGIVRREGLPSGSCRVRLLTVTNAAWSAREARSGETVTLSADV